MSKITNMIMQDAQLAYKKQIDESKRLVGKWKKTGLLEDLRNEYEEYGMAVMLENQARQLIDEISKTGTASNSEEWSGVALPLVRRIFGEISAKDFVSVQAMNLPSGLVFYLDFKYATAQPGFTTSDGSGATLQQNTLHGITNQPGDPSEGLYGEGRFGYSINDTSVALTSANGRFISGSTPLTWAQVNYDPALSASISAGHLYALYAATSSLTNPDLEGVRAFQPVSGNATYEALSNTTYYPRHTRLEVNPSQNVVTGTGADAAIAQGEWIRFVLSGSLPGTSATGSYFGIKYQKQPTDITRGDFEDTSGADVGIPEINVSLRSEPINAKTRKLKAVWTPEFAQDLNAYHSIDAEAELTSVLSEYISMEIDLEILDMLIENAVTTEYWSAKIGAKWNGALTNGEANFEGESFLSGTGLAYQQGSWFQTLGTKIQKISNKIHAKTMRGGANFLVVSPDVATIIESIPGYAADTDGNQMQFAMGVQKAGLLNSRFRVYKNPYMKENVILMGFRGSQFLETGAVYAPYIPLIMTPLIYDPTNFTPRKGIMTRYAKKVVRPEFYGKIYCTHTNLL